MSTQIPVINQRAELQVSKWEDSERLRANASQRNVKENLGPYLALSRETGARGSEIADAVANRLEWDLLDQEIVEYMNSQYGTPRCLIQRVDEKHENWIKSMVTAHIGGLGFSEDTYSHRVAVFLMMAATHGDVVIVGRGARFVLPKDRGLSVRIVASMDQRIEQVKSERGLEEKDARRFVIDTDQDRNAYIKSHFGVDATDPHHYDLLLNVTDLSTDEAVETIIERLDRWKLKSA